MKKLSIFFIFILVFVGFLGCVDFGYCSLSIGYNAGDNRIYFSGTSSDLFNDLYAEDVAQGWNVIDKVNDKVFLVSCRIMVGVTSASAVVSDVDKIIYFVDGALGASYQRYIEVMNGSSLTLGQLDDAGSFSTSFGCVVVGMDTLSSRLISTDSQSNGTINLYSCRLGAVADTSVTHGNGDIFNTVFCYPVRFVGGGIYTNLYNVISEGKASVNMEHFQPNGVLGLFDKFSAYGTGNAVYMYSSRNAEVSNMYGRDLTYAVRGNVWTGTLHLIDADIDEWSFSWTGTNTGVVYRDYTFSLTVLNGDISEFVEGANVTLYKDEDLIGSWLTNSSGMIGTQVLNYGWYSQGTGDSIQDGSEPFELVITHDDWADYVSKFYVVEPMRLTVSMQEVVATPTPAPTPTPVVVTPNPSDYASIEEADGNFVIGLVIGAVVVACLLLLVFRRRK